MVENIIKECNTNSYLLTMRIKITIPNVHNYCCDNSFYDNYIETSDDDNFHNYDDNDDG